MIPAQTSGVSAAQGVHLLACRWTPNEEGNAILQGVVVSAIKLKKRDILVARTCRATHSANSGVEIFGSADLIVRLTSL